MSEEIVSRHLRGSITVKNIEYSYKNTTYIGASFKIKIPMH